MKNDATKTSKFMSFVLRHKPDSIGLFLDQEGWANIDDFISCAKKNNTVLTRETIFEITKTSEKKRFAISQDGKFIRAVQGHSVVTVDIHFEEQIPPSVLYHGTTSRFLPSIREKGLVSGERQYVHLSNDEQTAIAVGSRHGPPVVLKINAQAMLTDGFKFFRAENGVWLTRNVPFVYITDSATDRESTITHKQIIVINPKTGQEAVLWKH